MFDLLPAEPSGHDMTMCAGKSSAYPFHVGHMGSVQAFNRLIEAAAITEPIQKASEFMLTLLTEKHSTEIVPICWPPEPSSHDMHMCAEDAAHIPSMLLTLAVFKPSIG